MFLKKYVCTRKCFVQGQRFREGQIWETDGPASKVPGNCFDALDPAKPRKKPDVKVVEAESGPEAA